MIDYLEQLLDQAPEDEQDMFPWPWVRLGYVAVGAGGVQAHSEKGKAQQEPNQAQEQTPEQLRPVDWRAAWTGAAAQADWQGRRLEKTFADLEFALTGAAQQNGQQEQQPEHRPVMGTEQTHEADLEMALSKLGRAVVRGKTDREALRWNRKTLSEAAEHGTAVPRMEGLRMAPSRGLVSRLDAAFERDARRYDGPLGLF